MRTVAALMLVVAVAACQLPRQAPVTPQRPTVSYDTSTTAPGTFELETGVTVDYSDAVDSPNTLKYGTADGTELFVGWSPLQYVVVPGQDAEGSGDVALGTRHRIVDAGDGTPSAALVLIGKLPTASSSQGLGTGEVDVLVGGILNQQFGPVNANAFYQYGALGNPNGGGTSSAHTVTLTAGTGITDHIGGFCELAAILVPSQDIESVFTIVGATFAAEPWLVFDAGAVVGLSDDAPDLQLFVGCTYNLGSPFGGR
jgi:hypothetical protein